MFSLKTVTNSKSYHNSQTHIIQIFTTNLHHMSIIVSSTNCTEDGIKDLMKEENRENNRLLADPMHLEPSLLFHYCL